MTESACTVLTGFPIRKSPGQSLFDSSPGHIAAYHVLHRLITPRHPPVTLNSLITSVTGPSLEEPITDEPSFEYLPQFSLGDYQTIHTLTNSNQVAARGEVYLLYTYAVFKKLSLGKPARAGTLRSHRPNRPGDKNTPSLTSSFRSRQVRRRKD